MVMHRSFSPKQLEEGLNTIFGLEYKQRVDEWRGCFEEEKSNKAFEEDVLQTGFGAAPVKAEGADVTFDDGREAWTSRYTAETISLGFSITEEALEDNLYTRLGPKYAAALARSLAHTKELKAAGIFNNGFDTGGSYNGGDGVPLLSTAHPLLGGGTASNKLATAADLSETSLEDALIAIRQFKDDRNIPVAVSASMLVVAPGNEYNARRILGSDLRVGTADNDLNAIKAKGVFGNGPKVITRLTDADAWFVRTNCPDSLKYMERVKVERKMLGDFKSGNLRYKARERYSFGWSDWRGIFGSEGAS